MNKIIKIGIIGIVSLFLSCEKNGENLPIENGIYVGTFTVKYSTGESASWSTNLRFKNEKYVNGWDCFSGSYTATDNKIIFSGDVLCDLVVIPEFDYSTILGGEYDYTFDGEYLKIFANKKANRPGLEYYGVAYYEYNLVKRNELGAILCDQNVIISATEFENAPNDDLQITNMEIVGNCLKIKFTTAGCNPNEWFVELIGLGNYDKSNPPQTTLRLSLDNKFTCITVAPVYKEISFNLEPLIDYFRHLGTNKIYLNISGKGILFEY